MSIYNKTVLGVFFFLSGYFILHAENFSLTLFPLPDGIDKHSKNHTIFSSPYFSKYNIKVDNDIKEEVKKREKDYTFHWLKNTLEERYLPDAANETIKFLTGVNKKDDAVFISTSVQFDPNLAPIFSRKGNKAPSSLVVYNIEIIDSRMLNVLVNSKEINQNNILDTFKKVFRIYSPFTAELQLVEKPDESTSFGKIKINTGTMEYYYINPVEWYQNGNSILFVFDKILPPKESKIKVPEEKTVGGLPYDDQRPYLRFENANRNELSQEYYHTYFKPEPAKGKKNDTGLNPDGSVRGGVIRGESLK